MNPRQGDLFLYGTESLICPINRKGLWVGCLGWQRGWARTFFLSNFFPFQPFSFISDKNRLMNVPNSYFFLNIFKNRLKWIKDPNLHDSPRLLQMCLLCILIIYRICPNLQLCLKRYSCWHLLHLSEAYAAHPACLPSDGFTLAAYEHHSHTTVFCIYALPQLTRYAQSNQHVPNIWIIFL